VTPEGFASDTEEHEMSDGGAVAARPILDVLIRGGWLADGTGNPSTRRTWPSATTTSSKPASSRPK
jgi:hypothetical protein